MDLISKIDAGSNDLLIFREINDIIFKLDLDKGGKAPEVTEKAGCDHRDVGGCRRTTSCRGWQEKACLFFLQRIFLSGRTGSALTHIERAPCSHDIMILVKNKDPETDPNDSLMDQQLYFKCISNL